MAEEEKLNEEVSVKKQEEREQEISKVVLKTGLLTALSFFLVLVFAFTIAAFISPKFISDMSFKIGAKNLSATFAIAQYKRTKGINDLATAVERSISVKNHKNIAEYGKLLVEFEGKDGKKEFNDFVLFKNETLNNYYEKNNIKAVSDYYNFIYGNYVYSLYKVNKKGEAFETAFLALGDLKYTINNPVRNYIDAYIEDSKRPDNKDLLDNLEAMYDGLRLYYDDANLINNPNRPYGLNISFDLMRLYDALNNTGKKNEWKYNYEHLYPEY